QLRHGEILLCPEHSGSKGIVPARIMVLGSPFRDSACQFDCAGSAAPIPAVLVNPIVARREVIINDYPAGGGDLRRVVFVLYASPLSEYHAGNRYNVINRNLARINYVGDHDVRPVIIVVVCPVVLRYERQIADRYFRRSRNKRDDGGTEGRDRFIERRDG